MKNPYVINVQKFSIHDGAGIRTTVFFKGCPLSCAWCHNPESQKFQRELMFAAEHCTGCGNCISICPNQAIVQTDFGTVETDRKKCSACGLCVNQCIYNARNIVGTEISVPELLGKLLRDRMFYEVSGGGITLSGGEVMAQNLNYIKALVQGLYQEQISVNIDTCGDVPYENFQQVFPYVDTFLYDFKAASPEIHKKYTGRDNRRIIENLKRLSQDGAKINLRIPVVFAVNSDAAEMGKMVALILENNIHLTQINLLPYHKAGMDKNFRLGRVDWQEFVPPTHEWMEKLKKLWLDAGFSLVLIGG